MKEIIDGVAFDDETARLVGSWSKSDFSWFYQEWWTAWGRLYCTPAGEYILFGDTGDLNPYVYASYSYKLTIDEAREWAERHMDADEYEAEFGEAPE